MCVPESDKLTCLKPFWDLLFHCRQEITGRPSHNEISKTRQFQKIWCRSYSTTNTQYPSIQGTRVTKLHKKSQKNGHVRHLVSWFTEWKCGEQLFNLLFCVKRNRLLYIPFCSLPDKKKTCRGSAVKCYWYFGSLKGLVQIGLGFR